MVKDRQIRSGHHPFNPILDGKHRHLMKMMMMMTVFCEIFVVSRSEKNARKNLSNMNMQENHAQTQLILTVAYLSIN